MQNSLVNWVFVCILLIMTQHKIYSQTQKPLTFDINEGDILVYDVRNGGDLYYYTITIKEFKSKIYFDWVMSDPIHKSGSVEIKPKALSKSMTLINYVNDGHLTFEEETIVWISKIMFKEISESKTPVIKIDDHEGNKMELKGYSKQWIKYKGNDMEIDVLDVSNNESFFDLKKFSILNNSKNPLLTRMNIGFTVELMEVK